MRTIRIACSVLALGVVLMTAAVPASAAVGPAAISTTVGKPSVGCSGDTVSGTVQIRSSAAVNVLVELLVREGTEDFRPSGRTSIIAAQAGTADYAYAVNVAGLPLAVKHYRIRVSSGSSVGESATLPAVQCAPDAVVPEVPSAALLPASLMTTGLVVLGVRRRRDRVQL